MTVQELIAAFYRTDPGPGAPLILVPITKQNTLGGSAHERRPGSWYNLVRMSVSVKGGGLSIG